MRVVDYIAARIAREGVKHVFLVSGGGMMFLSDAVYLHPDLTAVCNHHEQACAMAAVGYAKYTENLGVAFTSTGCGATNAITGLLSAWHDNVPCVFVSGQVKRSETVRGTRIPLRQFGTQEADIISIVAPLTKYAEMVLDPTRIRYCMDRAFFLARSGRPGPVWLDIPMDVQGAQIDPENLEGFDPLELDLAYKTIPTEDELSSLSAMLASAKRPVIIAGQGIRLGKAIAEFRRFVERHQIPVVAPYMGVGLLETDHPLYMGVIGTKASRAGNLAMQNADLIISIGSRLHVTAIGYEYHLFAREAKKVVIDIDPIEHTKKTVSIDLFINADVKEFFGRFRPNDVPDVSAWVEWCSVRRARYPVCLPEYRTYTDSVSMYHFVDTLSRIMPADAVVVSDAGSAFYVTTQAVNLRDAQRYITSGGQAEMGYTMPVSIGACIAKGNAPVLGITGDGSLQMNIQELQTIAYHQLPIKTFVLNNNGYLSIRTTQNKFFEGRLIGTDESSGVSFPDLRRIAKAYGIKYVRIAKSSQLKRALKQVLAHPGPVLCDVICPENEPVVPAAASRKRDDGRMESRPLEDMLPFLSRDEYRDNLLVTPVEDLEGS